MLNRKKTGPEFTICGSVNCCCTGQSILFILNSTFPAATQKQSKLATFFAGKDEKVT